MRLVVIGTNAGGQSWVERIEELQGDATVSAGGLLATEIWSSPALRTTLIARPRSAPLRPIDCAVGEISWKFVSYASNVSVGMHRTDTIDCDVVLEGRVELGLEAGAIQLTPGDLVLIPGLAHRWTAGSDGATLSAVLIGIDP